MQSRKRRGARGAMDFHAASKSTALRTHSTSTQAFDPATTKALVTKLFGTQSWDQGTQTTIDARFLSSIDGSQDWEHSITEMGTLHSVSSDGDTQFPENFIITPSSIAEDEFQSSRELVTEKRNEGQVILTCPITKKMPGVPGINLKTILKKKPEINTCPTAKNALQQDRTYTRVEARFLSSKVTFDLAEPTYVNLRHLIGKHFHLDDSEDLEMRLAKVDYRHLLHNVSRLVDDKDVLTALKMHQRDILKIRVIRRLPINPVMLASPRQPKSNRPSTHPRSFDRARFTKYRQFDEENNTNPVTFLAAAPAQGAEELFEEATRRYLRIENQVFQYTNSVSIMPQVLKDEVKTVIDMWSRAAQLGHVGAVHNLYCVDFLGFGEADVQYDPDSNSSYMLTQLGVFEDADGEEHDLQRNESCENNEVISLLSAPI